MSALSSSAQMRAIVLLALAGFASQGMVRAADTLLPQIAADLPITVGAASVVVSTYTVMHGSMQLIMGPIGDRFGKYRMVATMCALSAATVAACGFAHTLGALTAARIASGATASWIIPFGMAFIGDVVPYDKRQQVLGRYLAGQISGQMFGQAAGGIIGDWLGWRAVFFINAAIFALVAIALFREYFANPLTRPPQPASERPPSFAADYRAVLTDPWARFILLMVFLEAGTMFGAFAFVGAYLHLRFALSFTVIGLVVGTFAIGGLLFVVMVKWLVNRLGQPAIAVAGGLILGLAYLILSTAGSWWLAPVAVALIGLGFYMLHNTLQTHATQMSPRARGTAVGMFSAALYIGQTIGVALAAPAVDRIGAPAVFLAAAFLLPAMALWFSVRLLRREIA